MNDENPKAMKAVYLLDLAHQLHHRVVNGGTQGQYLGELNAEILSRIEAAQAVAPGGGDKVARVRFCHDLEDGWYRAKLPDGSVIERNHWKDLQGELAGFALLWVGSAYYRPDNFPVVDCDPAVDAFMEDVRDELIRARAKFPGDRIMTIALAEEFGELCKAILDESSANVRKEAVQTAVMAARVVLDGDGSVNGWRKERGLDPLVSEWEWHVKDDLASYDELHGIAAAPASEAKGRDSEVDRACKVLDAMPEMQRLLELRQYDDTDGPMEVTVGTYLIDGVMYEVRDTIARLFAENLPLGLSWPAASSAAGESEDEARARKLYEPDEYDDAFKGREQEQAGEIRSMNFTPDMWNPYEILRLARRSLDGAEPLVIERVDECIRQEPALLRRAARVEVTDAMVERAASRFMQVRGLGMHRAWESMTEETRGDYRTAFRAALTAALEPKE